MIIKILFSMLIFTIIYLIVGFTVGLITWPKLEKSIECDMFWKTFEMYRDYFIPPYTPKDFKDTLSRYKIYWVGLSIIGFPVTLLVILKAKHQFTENVSNVILKDLTK